MIRYKSSQTIAAPMPLSGLVGRVARVAAYGLRDSQQAAYVEGLLRTLPAEARWLDQMRQIYERAKARGANPDSLGNFAAMLNSASSLLVQISAETMAAAREAQADGWDLTIDGNSITRPAAGLGIAPLIVAAGALVVVAVAAVSIVGAYLAYDATLLRVSDYYRTRRAMEIFAENQRWSELLDLATTGSGGSISAAAGAAGRSFGTVAAVAGAGVLAYLLLSGRRKGAA